MPSPPQRSAPLAVVDAHGHPAISAGHDRTLELTSSTALGARGTCIVGVGARIVSGRLDGLAGPLLLTLSCAAGHPDVDTARDLSDVDAITFTAVANPDFRFAGDLVVRRSGNRLEDTLATGADVTAAGLPRSLVSRLQDPASQVRLAVHRAPAQSPSRPVVVLGRSGGLGVTAPRLAAEVASGAQVVADDADSERWSARCGHPAWTTTPEASTDPSPSGRRFVELARGLPGRHLRQLAQRASGSPSDWSVETAGLTAVEAAAAGLGGTAPVLDLTPERDRRRLDLRVAGAPSWARLVVSGRAGDARSLARRAGQAGRTDATGVIDRPGLTWRVWSGPLDQLEGLLAGTDGPRRDDLVVIGLAESTANGDDADLALGDDQRRLVLGLLRQGTPTGVVARALAGANGLRRNQAWRTVQRLGEMAAPPDGDDPGSTGPGGSPDDPDGP